MVSYPVLSHDQQHALPALIQPATVIPSKFEDSTHRLWHCDTVDGPMVLKVCDPKSIEQSVFWQGVNTLFQARFPESLEHIAFTHDYLKAYGRLVIPDPIASQPAAFVLSRFIEGQDVSETAVTDDLVIKLAEHLASNHQHTFKTWGQLYAPTLQAEAWSTHLQQTLISLAKSSPHTIPLTILKQALAEAEKIHIEEFVCIMPDLRWDQLRLTEPGQLALIDMDAFVIGPRELELILLDYLLTSEQLVLFQSVYQSHLPWPDLTECRLSYRLLLFLMNVLGVEDLDAWLQQAYS